MMFWYGNAGWAFWQVGLMWVAMIALCAVLVWLTTVIVLRKPQPDRLARATR